MKTRIHESTLDKKYDERKAHRLTLLFVVIAVLIVIYLALQFIIGISRVDGTSMVPTLSDSQTVVYWRQTNSYSTGDVICVKMPSGELYVKRIVAVAGDVVELKDGVLYVNGFAEENSYANGETYEEDGLISYPYVVGRGKYFVLGDNREASVDSRSFGAVVQEQVLGKLVGVE